MNMKLFFALTIGPIYKTMGLARHTKEIWMSSYFFSYLMEKICEALKDKGELIIPNTNIDYSACQAGLYPDRLIMSYQPKKDIVKDITQIIHDSVKKVADDFFTTKEDKDFFKKYILVHHTFIQLNDKDNPVDVIFPILESMEQRPTYVENYEMNKHAVYNLLKDPGRVDRYVKIFNSKSIPTLKDIAECECNTENPANRKYHNYLAYVQADGDGIGKLLHILYETGGEEALQKLSRFLFDFGSQAATEIIEFGGKPIYMGGDDMLFIAPVKYNNKTIFNLIDQLDRKFWDNIRENDDLQECISKWNSSITRDNKREPVHTGISFSVFVAYHKYPMKESLLSVREQLFYKAKSIPGKNSVYFTMLKHSGQCIETFWNKNNVDRGSYCFFLEILEKEAPLYDSVFLTSIQYKFKPLEPLISRILVGRKVDPGIAAFDDALYENLPNEEQRVLFFNNLTENFFNELVHDKEKKSFIKKSFNYLLNVYRELEDKYGNNSATAVMAINNLYAVLRFIQFINQKGNQEENF